MSLRIRPRRCPACRAGLAGEAGREWLTCPDCPLAVAIESGASVATYRPIEEQKDTGPRLPFWQLLPRQGPPVWVAAFRCFNQPQSPDLDRLLTERRYDPPLAAAPLGARLARGPEEARALAAARGRRGPPWAEARLVSLGAREEGRHAVEPVTGWRILDSLVRPWR